MTYRVSVSLNNFKKKVSPALKKTLLQTLKADVLKKKKKKKKRLFYVLTKALNIQTVGFAIFFLWHILFSAYEEHVYICISKFHQLVYIDE